MRPRTLNSSIGFVSLANDVSTEVYPLECNDTKLYQLYLDH